MYKAKAFVARPSTLGGALILRAHPTFSHTF